MVAKIDDDTLAIPVITSHEDCHDQRLTVQLLGCDRFHGGRSIDTMPVDLLVPRLVAVKIYVAIPQLTMIGLS